MATESPDGAEVSVSLPPDLEEWVDDRAAALDVDPQELLVQIATTYRTVADLDEPHPAALAGDGVDAETLEDVQAQLTAEGQALEDLDDRVDDVERTLEENVEDLRNRVLQLRDAVGDTAREDHSHPEFSDLGDRIDDLSESVEAVAGDVEAQADRVAEVESRLDDADEKLTRVARRSSRSAGTSTEPSENRPRSRTSG